MTHLSRREFGALTVSTLAPLALTSRVSAQAAPVSAADIITRIQKHVGVDWKADGLDAIKAGEAATVVSGIVTTAMASLDVLRQAVEAKANLVVTCEPTFYARSDARTAPAGRGGRGGSGPPPPPPPADRVFTAKNEFIDKHQLVVFRLTEHWRQRRPDPFVLGLAGVLEWTKHRVAADDARYAIPAVSLSALAGDIKKKLGSRGGIRVVGDPQTTVRTVALLPGSTPISAALDALPAVDLVIAGEVREWESVEYARDVAFSGQRKGLVLIGRVVSEDGGMRECARWLTPLVPEVRVRHLPAGDPYWRPA